MLGVGSECYSLLLKTADYKDQKFFSHLRGIRGRKGHSTSSRQGEEARRRRNGSGLEGLSGWRNEAREVAKDFPENDERLGPAPRSTACPALPHSSHRTHRRQSAQRPSPVKTPRDISPSADRHPLY